VKFERDTYQKTNNKVLFNGSNNSTTNESKEKETNKNMFGYGDENCKSEANFD
jgi:hypothetical protein